MKVFGIAGHSGMGKTTLLERLVPELTSRGLVVSLIKHSHKAIEIDRPGKDSYRLREAGCSEVLLLGNDRWALMHELEHRIGRVQVRGRWPRLTRLPPSSESLDGLLARKRPRTGKGCLVRCSHVDEKVAACPDGS